MVQLSQDPNFHYEIIRSLGIVRYLGGDIGEQLAVLDEITPGDGESWYTAWSALAQRVLSTIDEAHPEKHSAVSLRDAYFRASHYFFVADFFLHGAPADPRLRHSFDLWRGCFDRANALLPVPGLHFSVPTAAGFSVPLLVYRAPGATADKPAPTLLIGGGFDSNYEESLHTFGVAMLERGYNVVLYEGPGQPRLLHEQKKGFVFDWEAVVSPVMDFLIAKQSDAFPYIDARKVALVGLSMGGYLAARAAAFEPRLAAVVCIDGVWSMLDAFLSGFPDAKGAWDRQDAAAFDAAFEDPELLKRTGRRWMHDHMKFSFRKESGFEAFKEAEKMTLEGVAEKIKMPAFIGEAQHDIFFLGQPEQVAKAIGPNATLVPFTEEFAAGNHCQSGALVYMNQRIGDWLANGVFAEK